MKFKGTSNKELGMALLPDERHSSLSIAACLFHSLINLDVCDKYMKSVVTSL